MVKKAKENLVLLLKHVRHRFKRTISKYRGVKSVLLFPIIGILSLLWVIIRVAPKPSRLRYPCMKVAVPTATSFIAYAIAIFTSLFSFRKAKEKLKSSKYAVGILLLLVSVAGGTFLVLHTNQYARAQQIPVYKTRDVVANEPMGTEQGDFPGRVVWVHNPDATNEDCTLNSSDGWYLDKNNNQYVIDVMLDTAVIVLSEQSTIADAWDSFFKYNNSNRGKGDVGYIAGEIIFIKINRTASYSYNPGDFSRTNYLTSETSPHVVLALLRHLVDEVGVAEEDIYIGDPLKHIYKLDYELWHGEFPDIHYLDNNRSDGGRERVVAGQSIIHYSDRGEILRESYDFMDASSGDPIYDDHFYTIFDSCDYLINVPTLKGHKRAGVTMFAKNHFGSHTRMGAEHLHMGLVVPDEYPNEQNERYGYGKYRVLVDLMGWELLREKNVIYLMDALWSAGYELAPPSKWQNPPFNDDWSSSIFISQDPVAIESVGYDFLRTEYTEGTHGDSLTYPQLEGADDHLEQAADSTNWPDGFIYDPEDDGTPIPSLGVHEHWNNATDRQYSRNLGEDYGIELVSISANTPGVTEDMGTLAKPTLKNSPNPFRNSTSINYNIVETAKVKVDIYNITGQITKTLVNETKTPGIYSIVWDATSDNGAKVPNGVYFCKLRTSTNGADVEITNKMLLVK